MTRGEVIREARSWIGTRFRHQGRSHDGVDCAGLVVMVARSFGVPVDDMPGYSREPNTLLLLHHLRKHLVFVPPDHNRDGTVGIFRQVRLPCHVGILSRLHGMPHVIHARMSLRQVVEEALVGDPALNLIETGAFPGMED